MGWFVEWTFATTYNIARESGQLQLQEEANHEAVSMVLIVAVRCGGAETTLKSGS